MDKRSDSDSEEVQNKAKPLEDDGVLVIPVALGNEADQQELLKTISDEDNLIVPGKNDVPKSIAEKIMKKATEG